MKENGNKKIKLKIYLVRAEQTTACSKPAVRFFSSKQSCNLHTVLFPPSRPKSQNPVMEEVFLK